MSLIEKFEALVSEGYLRKSEKGDLVLYGYTDKCTFDRHWTPETRMARGIILNKLTGEIIARPFPKFFNLGETSETFLANLPDQPYTVHEKLDGSLGIIFFDNTSWQICTRGSFYSDQAIKGAEILKKYDMFAAPYFYTFLVEIIYPDNKIVVNYGQEEKLVLLAAYNNINGLEIPHKELKKYASFMGMEIANTYNYTIPEMIELQKTLPKDQEGFVIRFESGLRVKIKGAEYMKISRLISRMSPISFWECMENGVVKTEYLQQLPEEFRLEYEPIKEQLEKSYISVRSEVESEFKSLPVDLGSPEVKKLIGLYLQKDTNIKHSGAMFSMLNNKLDMVDKYVMKYIRPKGNELKF